MKIRLRCGARQAGLTLPLFMLVVLLSSALSAFALTRFERQREQREIAATRAMVAALRGALQAHSARQPPHDAEQRLRELAARNPIALLAAKPDNYLGELVAPDPKRVGAPGWVYDPRDSVLVYLPKNTRSFSFGTSRLLKFKVEFDSTRMRLALNQVSS